MPHVDDRTEGKLLDGDLDMFKERVVSNLLSQLTPELARFSKKIILQADQAMRQHGRDANFFTGPCY